ncbi:hypothetical protein VWN94_10330, partial [Campylobacter coli]|nr:hypothetical protein [Campylobacter coli]
IFLAEVSMGRLSRSDLANAYYTLAKSHARRWRYGGIFTLGGISGYENRVKIALDVASTEFFKEGKYHMEGKAFSSEDLIERYVEL